MLKIKNLIGGLCALALVLVAGTACSLTGNDESATSNVNQDDKTVKIALGGTLDSLNPAVNNTSYNSKVAYLTSTTFAYFNNKMEYVNNDLAGSMKKISDDPLTIQYNISKNQQWSDGQPVTCADYLINYAASSGVYNDDVEISDEGEPVVKDNQIYFEGQDGISEAIDGVPTCDVANNPNEFVVKYSHFVSDWKYVNTSPSPAHVIAEIALGIDDPETAVDRLVAAIKDPEAGHDDLVKIANQWTNGWGVKGMPKDSRLLVSSGAYMIDDIKDGQYVSLKKNPNYKSGQPTKIGHVIFRYTDDPDAEKQALENGEIDLLDTSATNVDFMNGVKGISGIKYDIYDEGIYRHIDLQQSPKMKSSPFSAAYYDGDAEKAKKVRQAFLLGLPKQELVDKLVKPINPDAVVMNSFTTLPNDTNYYKSITDANGSSEYPPAGDPAKAKKILEDAGITTPVKVRFFFANVPDNVKRFKIISEAEKAAGFNVVDSSCTAADFGTALPKGNYDANIFSWVKTSDTFSNSAANYKTGASNNFLGYSNAEVDKLWDEVSATDDVAKQASIVGQIEKILNDDAFGTSLFSGSGILAYSPKIKNVTSLSFGNGALWDFWDWEFTE